jgi:hypothetical protein
MTVIDQSRNRVANLDRVVVEGLANEFHVPVRTVERTFSEILDAIPAYAEMPHIDFVLESRARMRLFRTSLAAV